MGKNRKGEKILKQLRTWEADHLRLSTRVRYVSPDRNNNDAPGFSGMPRCIVFREYEFISDSKKRFALGEHGEAVAEWIQQINREIDIFYDRQAMRSRLNKSLRKDTVYDRMEQLFYSLGEQAYHLLCFFQYDRIADDQYREAMQKQIGTLMTQLDNVLDYYSSYLDILGTSVSMANDEEIDQIRIAVESMKDALETAQTAF